jgi:HEAT repeat protein
LIAKYQRRASTAQLSVLQRFQTSEIDTRAELLASEVRTPSKEAQELAFWATCEPDYETRVLSMQLFRKLDVAQSKTALLRGLYDSNGYVNKAAANSLVSYGKDIEPLMMWVLDDKGSKAPFYAMQILAAIGAPKAADKISVFLHDDDPQVRIMSAESLVSLRAVSALPQLEAALQVLPKESKQQESYQAALNRAVGELKNVRDGK